MVILYLFDGNDSAVKKLLSWCARVAQSSRLSIQLVIWAQVMISWTVRWRSVLEGCGPHSAGSLSEILSLFLSPFAPTPTCVLSLSY